MTVNWTINCWAQQRNILTLSNFSSGTEYIELTVAGHSELTAKYVVPTSGTLQIDLSDLVRMYASGSWTATERGGQSETSTTMPWTRSGLISPTSVLIPDTDVKARGFLVSPPSRMYHAGLDIWCETYFTNSYQIWQLSGAAIFQENGRRIACIGNFSMTDAASMKVCRVEEMANDCREMVNVQWRSFTGATRRHAFEVIKETIETTDAVQLQTMTDGYEEMKGRRDGFAIRIDGLDRYDMWYYGDIVTSGDVQVSFDNGTTWERVQVTTKNIELPNSDDGAFGVLEIAVNYKHYDTL